MESFGKMGRVLTFRSTREELASLGPSDLALGLAVTWVVGVGRYWDDPGAHFLQYLGFGSLIDIPTLSIFIGIFLAGLLIAYCIIVIFKVLDNK